MEQLEELFVKMIEEKKSEIIKTLKDSLLEEIIALCYEMLSQAAINEKVLTSADLYKEVLKRLEKDAS